MLDLHRDMRAAYLDAQDQDGWYDPPDSFDDERAPEPSCLTCGMFTSACECGSEEAL